MAEFVLVEGLKGAVSKGESLRDAMISFFNAGYEKGEIEKAARELQKQQQGQPIVSKTPVAKKVVKEKPIKKIPKPVPKPIPKVNLKQNAKPIQRVSSYGSSNPESIKKIKQGINSAIDQLNRIEFPNGNPQTEQITKQKISGYGQKQRPKQKGAVIALIISLIVLIGILAGVFIFREQILDFFDKSSFFSGLF